MHFLVDILILRIRMVRVKKMSPVFIEYCHIFGLFDMTQTIQQYLYWRIGFAETKQVI